MRRISETFAADETSSNNFDVEGLLYVSILDSLNHSLLKIRSYHGLKDVVFDPTLKRDRQEIMKHIHNQGDYSRRLPEKGIFDSFSEIRNSLPTYKTLFQLPVEHEENNNELDVETLVDKVCSLHRNISSYLKERAFLAENESYQELKSRNGSVKSEIKVVFSNINEVQGLSRFYVDLENPKIVPVKEIPSLRSIKIPIEEGDNCNDVAVPVKRELKSKVVGIHDALVDNFRRYILDYLKEESTCSKDKVGLFKLFSEFATPFLLMSTYLGEINGIFNHWEKEDENEFIETLPRHDLIFPSFSDHFDLKNLFPYTKMANYEYSRGYVPLDFETKPGEKKFLFTGMNSAGKSFLLENLVVAGKLCSMGLPLLANSAVFPDFNKWIYNNNTKRKEFGKIESEMASLRDIAEKAEEDDIVIIDNYFEGGTPQVTAHLAHQFMEKKLTNLDSYVFVESHVPLDLDYFQGKGWVIYSPGYEIDGDLIRPTFRIKRGIPEQEVVSRYAAQLAESYLK